MDANGVNNTLAEVETESERVRVRMCASVCVCVNSYVQFIESLHHYSLTYGAACACGCIVYAT